MEIYKSLYRAKSALTSLTVLHTSNCNGYGVRLLKIKVLPVLQRVKKGCLYYTMNFDEIKELVLSGDYLPDDATMAEQQAYHTLKCLNFEFKHQLISKERASKAKNKLIRDFEEQKRLENYREEYWKNTIANINTTEQLRIELIAASKSGELSKSLWLKAVECIYRLCGDKGMWHACETALENVPEDGVQIIM